MPLVRLQVRNEYGLGRPELYEETNREDPKAVLDGVAVAGLVGILRQLGDLADFAAEVFHGLQEQVLTTASRSHKLMLRAQNIEAYLPPLEKAILAQTSHIHFAYTAGCEWHCRTKTEQNHFIYNDLPQFIMDSYEDCRDPPCLHLLDKFDTGGPGSCLRRYSDPTFFKRASAYSDEAYTEKIERARKTRRSKKKRLSRMNGEILQGERVHNNSGRMQFASHVNGQTSSSQTASKIDVMLKSDLEDHSYSFDSRADDGYIECVFQPSNSVQLDEQEYTESPSSRLTQKTDTLHLASLAIDYNFSHDSFDKQIASTSTGLTWDEKEEMVASKSQPCERDETPEVLDETQNLHMHENEAVTPANTDHSDFLYGEESNLKPVTSRVQIDEVDSELDNYLDAFNTIESESENDLDCERKREVEQVTSHVTCEIMENGVGATFTVLDHDLYDVTSQTLSSVSLNKETGWDFPETLREIPSLISERHVTSLRSPVRSDISVNIERTKILADSHDSGSPIHELVPDMCGNSVLDCSVGTNPLNDACSLNDIVSASIETVPSDVPFNIERTKNFADSYASESPIHEQEPHICGNSILDCSIGTNPLGDAHTLDDAVSASIETVPSNVPVNRGGTENLADSLASENHIGEQVPHIGGNFLLDCSVGTNPLGNAHTLNDMMSASIETVPPDVFVNLGRTRNLADSLVSESPIHEQEPHICGNSVLDCSMGTNPLGDAHTLLDAVSASIETDPSNVPVNRRRTENLADSFASENPIREQVPHICESSLLDCSVGSDPLGNAHTLNDTVSASIETVPPDFFANSGRTKNLADSHVSESPIHEQEPHICGNSVLDCSMGTNPLGDAHTLDDALSPSIETVPSNVPVNPRRTEDLADSLASENPIREQVPHICGNSVLDCSVGTNPLGNVHTLNDTVTASSETVPPDVFVNLGRTKNLADSHASESHICEQVPHVCGNSVLECSVGTNPLGDAHTLNDSVSAPIETVPLDAPVDSERTKNLADSHASEGTSREQLPRICGNSVLDCSGGTNPLGDAQTLNDKVSASNETDISSGSKSSDLPDNEADSINSNICKSKEIPSESASDPSVGLWTNGGLLGLEPSKPPDFIMSSSLNQGSMTSINETDSVLNHNSMLKSNGYGEEQDLSAEIAELNQNEPSSRSLISHCDDQACISGKTSDCHQLSSGCNQNDEESLDENRVLAPGTVLPVAQDAKTAYTEPNKESGLNSPLMFGLSHKLLLNSFCQKVSFDEKSGPDNSWKTGILEQGGQNDIVQQLLPETICKEQVSYGYPICSPPPSPPLEHMKISFRPINGFETFKLKLKFPDGSNHRESTRDMFPSFRLVPEPSIPLHDSGSNSDDDDTFCRSSPFVSDDCLSPHSDYNSDQWESDDTPDISDHGVYNSSQRISLTESKSSSQEIIGVTNAGINLDSGLSMYTQYSVEPSLSGHLLDFPSFDTVNPALEKECDRHSDYNNNLKLQGHVEPIPPAPPLPPKQGWHSNLQLDMMNGKQICISKDTEQINDPNISESTLQLRPALVEQNLTDHEHHEFYDYFSCKSKDKLNQQNMNEQKKENLVGIGKDTDGKEDFFHQIGTKSFNLKHTITGMPNAITNSTTMDKVTAILEKANAIRQVVASDDGEDDDNWSDL